MSTFGFQKLDQCTIAIDLEIGGRQVEMMGVAAYERLTDLAAILRVHVADPAGDFDLILSEDQWAGKIVEDRKQVCEFRVSLTASELMARHS
jgi:hypothetical protein